MWSYCIKQVGCSAFPTSSRHDHSRWVDRGRRGGRAQLGPTVPTRRADGTERLEAPRGTGQWLGQLQMGRLQPGCCSSVTSGRPARSRPAPVLGRALAPSARVRRGMRARTQAQRSHRNHQAAPQTALLSVWAGTALLRDPLWRLQPAMRATGVDETASPFFSVQSGA